MNDNKEVPNNELREYVTSSTFALQLTRHQIEMLIIVASNNYEAFSARGRIGSHNVPIACQLKRRGLLLHQSDVYGREVIRYFGSKKVYRYSTDKAPFQLSDIYRLTRAGWAVYDLLVEAGMAQAIKPQARRYAA